MLSQKKAAAPFTGSFYSHRHLPLFISNEVKKLKYRGKEYDYFLFTDEAFYVPLLQNIWLFTSQNGCRHGLTVRHRLKSVQKL